MEPDHVICKTFLFMFATLSPVITKQINYSYSHPDPWQFHITNTKWPGSTDVLLPWGDEFNQKIHTLVMYIEMLDLKPENENIDYDVNEDCLTSSHNNEETGNITFKVFHQNLSNGVETLKFSETTHKLLCFSDPIGSLNHKTIRVEVSKTISGCKDVKVTLKFGNPDCKNIQDNVNEKSNNIQDKSNEKKDNIHDNTSEKSINIQGNNNEKSSTIHDNTNGKNVKFYSICIALIITLIIILVVIMAFIGSMWSKISGTRTNPIQMSRVSDIDNDDDMDEDECEENDEVTDSIQVSRSLESIETATSGQINSGEEHLKRDLEIQNSGDSVSESAKLRNESPKPMGSRNIRRRKNKLSTN